MAGGAKRGRRTAKVRRACLGFPGAAERSSHGTPTFFVGAKRSFAIFADHIHGDGRLAIWCAAPPGAQAMLIDSEPEHYFVPPYVGPSGWIGVRLDRKVKWKEIAALIESAYLTRAPVKLAAAVRGGHQIKD